MKKTCDYCRYFQLGGENVVCVKNLKDGTVFRKCPKDFTCADWQSKEIQFADTVKMMLSDDYKERFQAEYYQTKIRYDKLHTMCIKYQANKLDFVPQCSLELLQTQEQIMYQYLNILEIRACIEKVEI